MWRELGETWLTKSEVVDTLITTSIYYLPKRVSSKSCTSIKASLDLQHASSSSSLTLIPKVLLI